MVVVAESVRWHTVLTGWQTDAVALVGLAVEVTLAVTYLWAASRPGRRPWPASATACFLGGLAVVAFALQSGFAAYDDVYWVHVVQHVVLMSVAPGLLALGAPVMLALRVLPTPAARRVVGVLRHRTVRALCGRAAAVHLPLDYYGLMFVYLLTPAYALSLRNAAFHVGAHAVFLTCGLLFWVPIVGVDPSGWRPAQRTKVALVAAGLPVNAVLAAAAGSWSLLVATEAVTLPAIAFVALRGRRRVRATVRLPRQRAAAVAPVGQL